VALPRFDSVQVAHAVVLRAGSVLAIRVPGAGAELPCDAVRGGEEPWRAAQRALRLHVGGFEASHVAELCVTALAPAGGPACFASGHLLGLDASAPPWLGVAVAWLSPVELLESPNREFHRALLLQMARRGFLPSVLRR
jgi:hypothetical protein